MTIYNLSDFETFFGALDECKSDVVLTTEDGCQYNWGIQKGAFRSLVGSLCEPHMRQLGIHTRDAGDRHILFEYLTGASRKQRTA